MDQGSLKVEPARGAQVRAAGGRLAVFVFVLFGTHGVVALLRPMGGHVFWNMVLGALVFLVVIRLLRPWFQSSYMLKMSDKKQTEIPVSRVQTKRLRELFKL